MAIYVRVGLPCLALGIFALAPLRPDIVCCRRPGQPAGPGTADRRWRKIGAPG